MKEQPQKRLKYYRTTFFYPKQQSGTIYPTATEIKIKKDSDIP